MCKDLYSPSGTADCREVLAHTHSSIPALCSSACTELLILLETFEPHRAVKTVCLSPSHTHSLTHTQSSEAMATPLSVFPVGQEDWIEEEEGGSVRGLQSVWHKRK